MSFPEQRTLPLSGSQNLAASWAQVDLPEPLGPTRAVTFPSCASKLMPWRTSSSPYPNRTFRKDLSDWAHSIADLLVPGGTLLLRDDHPLLDALGYESLTITEDYLSGTGSIDYESDESYVEGSAGKIARTANHNWRHDFQEIVGSLLAAGLSIEAFRESPHAEWKALPFLVETEQGWTMPEGMPKIPLSFAIVARKLQE